MSLDKTGDQAGIDRQVAECVELAERRNVQIIDTLTDNDISATSGKRRPSFERLLELVKAGTVDTIVAWHPDRLYRRTRDLELLIELVEQRHVRILTVSAGDFDLNTPAGRAVARTLVSWGTYEVEQKNERQRAAYKQRAERGVWHFANRPFGYERVDGAVIQVEHEAAIVKDLMTRYYEHGQSRWSLVQELNERGILSPQGKPWGVIQMRDLLKNPRYAGISLYKGVEQTNPGDWAPIIAETDWRRWQSTAAQRKRRSTFSPAKYLLTGIAHCGVCGAVCYVKRRGEAAHYTCSKSQCVWRSLRKVDDLVSGVLIARLSQPDALETLRPKAVDVQELLDDRAATQERLDSLAFLAADGTLSPAAVREAAQPLRAQIEKLTARIDAVSAAESFPLDLSEGRVREQWNDLPLVKQRALVRSLARVTILRQSQKAFDPACVRIDWES